ncbi:MAG: hypothetical protein NVS9B2_28430 [Steroidobacteraceae bacterium]
MNTLTCVSRPSGRDGYFWSRSDVTRLQWLKSMKRVSVGRNFAEILRVIDALQLGDKHHIAIHRLISAGPA